MEVEKISDGALPEKLLEIAAVPDGVGRRTEHGNLPGMRLGRRKHRSGFRQIGGHPGLAKDMLSGLERRDGNGRVELRRGADPDHIEIVAPDHLLPSLCHLGNRKLPGERLGSLSAPVANHGHVDARYGAQTWEVPQPDNAAGPHDSDSHIHFTTHDGFSIPSFLPVPSVRMSCLRPWRVSANPSKGKACSSSNRPATPDSLT